MFKQILLCAAIAIVTFSQDTAAQAGGLNEASRSEGATVRQLSNNELDTYLAHPERVLLIDVRRPDEISAVGGFPVYLNIQVKDLKNHLAEIPRDRPIITVSNHAARASVAAELLLSQGFNVLGTVGVDTYQKSGGTLTIKFPIPLARPKGTSGIFETNSQSNTGKEN